MMNTWQLPSTHAPLAPVPQPLAAPLPGLGALRSLHPCPCAKKLSTALPEVLEYWQAVSCAVQLDALANKDVSCSHNRWVPQTAVKHHCNHPAALIPRSSRMGSLSEACHCSSREGIPACDP